MKNIEVEIPKEVQKYFPTIWNGQRVYFDGVQLMVDNFEDTDEFKSLKLHNSIVALGIKGIGPATAIKLHKANIDLFTLLSQNAIGLKTLLLKSPEFKEGRDLEILIQNVFDLTEVELWSVIYSLGYRNCGKTISKQLAKWFINIDYDFKGLEKQVVENFINSQEAQTELIELVSILNMNNVQVINPTAPKAGIITFEMSGDCSTHSSKNEFKREVESSGKCIHSSLNKDTTYLITASLASQTTKMIKAEKNGTKIVTYEQFLDIIASL